MRPAIAPLAGWPGLVTTGAAHLSCEVGGAAVGGSNFKTSKRPLV
jgi:hypothetical protein